MGWDRKPRGGLYYYSTRRAAGRVVKVYHGAGPAARLLADLHADERRARLELRRARRAAREAFRADVRRLTGAVSAARALLAAHLTLAGYHCHRGCWRKSMPTPKAKGKQGVKRRRRPKVPPAPTPPVTAAPTAAPAPAPPELPPEVARLRGLTGAAMAGGPDELAALRAYLDRNPDLVAHVGSLSRAAEVPWVVRLTGEDVLRRECVFRELEALRSGLAGERPTTLESLLVDQVVACHAAASAAQALAASPGTLGQGHFGVRQLESAQRRLLAAVKALTTLRDLAPAAREPAPTLKIFREGRRAA